MLLDRLVVSFRNNIITLLGIVAFSIPLFTYVCFESYAVFMGPRIALESLHEITTVSNSLLVIRGSAENIATLSLNGSAIATTPEGTFAESVLMAPGHNTVVLTATDKAGNRKDQALTIMYRPLPEVPALGEANVTSETL